MPALLLAAILHLTDQTTPPPDPTPPPKVGIVDMTEGTGDAVKFGDEVTVDYTGKLTNGKKFDSSKNPGRTPFSLIVGLGQVIRGWDEGLIGMKVGGIRKLTIPYQLGYGERGNPPVIPAKADLVFTVALHKVVPKLNEVKVEITTAGHGPGLDVGQVATVIYTAKVANGKYFITKKELPEPTRVEYGRTPLLTGLALGIHGMKAGETRKITVPPDLAFGAEGRGPIGPNATLVFEVQLFSIEPPKDFSGGPDQRQ